MQRGGPTVDGQRSALIVASYDYHDPGLRRLRAPARDAEALAGVLSDPAIGGFDVRTMLNEPSYVLSEAVEDFFADRGKDDLLLMHFSCHGIKDEDGELFFASTNTKLRRLAATAVSADFVNRRMNRSRSRRIVLLLDCCYAGAFERGMRPRADTAVHIRERFDGRGRAVITASGALEYAFEGESISETSEPAPSVFTSAVVKGLATGEADRDQDGWIALDELYDYVYDAVREVTPNQTPSKWTFGVEGELYIARRNSPVSIPVALPPELQDLIDNPFASVRAAVVEELQRLLRARHAGLKRAAELALKRLAEDDSRSVRKRAAAALTKHTQGTSETAGPPEVAPTSTTPASVGRSTTPRPGAKPIDPIENRPGRSIRRPRREYPTDEVAPGRASATVRPPDATTQPGSLLARFEKRVDALAEGSFVKVFKGVVHPVEILNAIQREAEAHRSLLAGDHTLVPNRYVVGLSPYDHSRLAPYASALAEELAQSQAEFIGQWNWTVYGDVIVEIERGDDLHTGMFRVAAEVHVPTAESLRAIRESFEGVPAEGGFVKVFKGVVHPVEILNAMQREAEAHRSPLAGGYTLVPNRYVVGLSPYDHSRLAPYASALAEELAQSQAEFIGERNWTVYGDVIVEIERGDDLHAGMLRVAAEIHDR